jgi:hypothetical protein
MKKKVKYREPKPKPSAPRPKLPKKMLCKNAPKRSKIG